MHDHFGKPIKVGDIVLIPAVVKSCMPGDSCCLSVETILKQPAKDGTTSSFSTLNAAQVVRNNKEDRPLALGVSLPVIYKLDLGDDAIKSGPKT
jgi:hypothetical protein